MAQGGKTYSIGEPFLEPFLQKGMRRIIYDVKFPVLAGAAQKALLYAQPYHKRWMAEYAATLEDKKKAAKTAERARLIAENKLAVPAWEAMEPLLATTDSSAAITPVVSTVSVTGTTYLPVGDCKL